MHRLFKIIWRNQGAPYVELRTILVVCTGTGGSLLTVLVPGTSPTVYDELTKTASLP